MSTINDIDMIESSKLAKYKSANNWFDKRYNTMERNPMERASTSKITVSIIFMPMDWYAFLLVIFFEITGAIPTIIAKDVNVSPSRMLINWIKLELREESEIMLYK
jgi:hypothetical protein